MLVRRGMVSGGRFLTIAAALQLSCGDARSLQQSIMTIPSFVSIVNRCDNFRLEYGSDNFTEFRLSLDSKHIIGLIPPDVLEALKDANLTSLSAFQPPLWDIRDRSQAGTIASHGHLTLDLPRRYCLDGKHRGSVTFREWADTPAKRTEALKTLTERWRDSGLFSNIISPRLWRDELYPVYIDAFGSRTEERIAFVLERTACALFGLVTYGVHMTMYTADWKIWVPTRAKTKQTWVVRMYCQTISQVIIYYIDGPCSLIILWQEVFPMGCPPSNHFSKNALRRPTWKSPSSKLTPNHAER